MRSPRRAARLAGPQTGKSEITVLLPGRTTSPSTPLTCIFSQRSHQNSKAAIKRGVPVDSEALTATATATRGAARGQPAGTGPGPSKPARLRPRHREGRAALEGGCAANGAGGSLPRPCLPPGREHCKPSVCFTAPSRPGAAAGASASEPAESGVHLGSGSGRVFFPKGRAVDLKRHFKDSSILI